MTLRLSALIGFALLQAASPTPNPQYQRYMRAVTLSSSADSTACALLPPEVFAHAAPSLADLRLYGSGTETPYAITMSEAAASTESARILNLGLHSGRISFDLVMPARPYTQVTLGLNAHDFIATAHVVGLASPASTDRSDLGELTLFDLTGQGLWRNTTLNLQEATFPALHIELEFTPAPGSHVTFKPEIVLGAQVPPSREAQTIYTQVAAAAPTPDPARRLTTATFELPAHVPVERVRFQLDPNFHGNFSRPVTIAAHTTNSTGAPLESLSGEITRVDLPGPHAIHEAQLTVPATLGMNMQHAATVEVSVEDGDDRSLPITAVELEMRERKLCFMPSAQPLTLFYGDPTLHAPSYDFARLFSAINTPGTAHLEAELPNPSYTPRPDPRPYTERHPELLWIVLLVVIGVLAVVAFRSTKQLRQHHHK